MFSTIPTIGKREKFFLRIIFILQCYICLIYAFSSQSVLEIRDGTKLVSQEYIKIDNTNINNIFGRQNGFRQIGKLCYSPTIEDIYKNCMIALKNYNKYWVI